MTQQTNVETKSVVPAPPNPVQREVMRRMAAGPVGYVYADPAQGALLAWNVAWQRMVAGRRTLICCGSAVVREKLDTLFGDSGLEPLVLADGDTPESIRRKITSRKRGAGRDPFEALPWQQWKRRRLAAFKHSAQPLFGDRSYRVLGEKWFHARINGEPNILEARLDPSLFQFTPQEFYQLRGRIIEAESLFNPVLLQLHALERLHGRFFTDMAAEEAEEWLFDHLDATIVDARGLLTRLHNILAYYKKTVQDNTFAVYARFHAEVVEVQDRIEAMELQYGKEFSETTGGLPAKLKGSFSGKSKEVEQGRKQIKLAYMELHRALEASPFGPYIAPFEDLSMSSIKSLLDLQLQRLKEAWPPILQRARESQGRLNSQNMEGSEEQLLVIVELEKDIEKWLRELNERKLFAKPVEENALSLPKKGEILAQLLRQLQEVQSQLPRFVPLHQWMSFWLHLPDPTRKLTRLLGEEHNGDWLASTEAWYFSQLLAQNQSPVHYASPGADVPGMWWKKRQVQVTGWLQEYADLEPDGGWLTRINQLPETEPIVRDDDPEWKRLFPIEIHDGATKGTGADEELLVIAIDLDDARAVAESWGDRMRLWIRHERGPVWDDIKQKQYDPRKAWPSMRDALRDKSVDKIRAIRPVAESLIYELAPARLFQTRDMLLISRWPSEVEEQLVKKVGRNFKLQTIETEDDVTALMEALLDNDRPLCLLVEDHSLHFADPIWDAMVLGWCTLAGIRVVNLDWADVWKSDQQWLDDVLVKISQPGPDHPQD